MPHLNAAAYSTTKKTIPITFFKKLPKNLHLPPTNPQKALIRKKSPKKQHPTEIRHPESQPVAGILPSILCAIGGKFFALFSRKLKYLIDRLNLSSRMTNRIEL
jgi:hypothetical protein